MAALNWLRFVEVLRRWRFLENLNPAPPIFYLGITGLVWGLLGSSLVWGLFLGRSWTPGLMRVSALGYAIYYWLDRLLIADPTAISVRWPFALGLTISFLIFTFWVFSRPKVGVYFHQE